MNFAELFAPHPSSKQLIELLRRLAISLEAGIDIRTTFANEAARSKLVMHEHMQSMSELVNTGSSLSDALQATGEYFPPLVRELVSVGEQTGHLPEVLKQLVEHYQQQQTLQRTFWTAVSWPLFQLGVALAVIGFLIWFSAVIRRMTGNPTDLLGVGLTGELGLLVYLIFLAILGAGVFLVYRASVTGQLWATPVQRFVLRIPMLGPAIRTLSIARFAWTLHIALDTAIDVKKALLLSLASTHNIEFTEQGPKIEQVISRGHPIHEALREAKIFPFDLVHTVQVGEESGRLSETLGILARQELESARIAFSVLTKAAGWGVWVLVAAFIIMLIFRMAGVYFGSINQALKQLNR
jgi:type IV pilus assembly protein PilC